MATEFSQRLHAKLDNFMTFSNAESAFLDSIPIRTHDLAPRQPLISEGTSQSTVYVLLEGWGCCFKTLDSGRRQIINFPTPGDFLGMRSAMLRVADHSYVSISPVRVGAFPSAILRDLFTSQPRIGQAILWSMARDEAIIVEHLVNVGRRDALEAMSHFFLETLYRLKMIGLNGSNEFPFSITQEDLADALGMSAVHVNRVLRQLREQGAMTFRNYRVSIDDVGILARIAGYDPSYLDLPPKALP